MKPKTEAGRRVARHQEKRASHSHSPFSSTIGRKALLDAIRSVSKAAGRGRITQQQFLDASLLEKRDIFTHFSTWHDALRAAACRKRLPATAVPVTSRRPRVMRNHTLTHRIAFRPVCGEPLPVPGPLFFAPTNEHGVVLLFGKLAEKLGFLVLGLQTAFPDCMALHRIAPGNWQPVTIEFEFESKNFRTHGHDPEGCDFIVCWEHNWAECPENLEIIALSDEIKRIVLLERI
jgi:hypothetical protein